MNTKSYPCMECGFLLGEDYASRALELHGIVICGGCAQKRSPVYQEWLREEALREQEVV